MLPIFPHFKEVEVHDKQHIEIYTKRHLPSPTLTLQVYGIFNTEEECEISTLNDNFVMKFQDYVTSESFYTFLGDTKVLETIQTLLNRSTKNNIHPQLKLIPAVSIVKDEKEIRRLYNLQEDPDNHDYVFSIEEIASMKGNKYYNQRNLVNRFKKKVQGYEIKELDIRDKQVREQIIELALLRNQLKTEPDEINREIKVIKRAMDSHEYLNLIVQGVYIDGKLVSMSTNEVLHGNYAIAHFRKADTRYPGIYQFQEQETAKHLLKLGCFFMNYEQDEGIHNLRRAKKSWNPVYYLKKYIITHK